MWEVHLNALGYNYPAGAEHDPSAPWNQKPEEDGETAGERRERIAIEKADAEMDREKDER